MEVEGTFLGVNGVRLRTLRWYPNQRAKGRVVVVHGFSEHIARYRPLASYLTNRGFSVFGYDHRGHGRSEGVRGRLDRFDDLVDDLKGAIQEAVTELPGEGPPFLFGHSMGALVALRHLQAGGEIRAAVLSAPWLGTILDVSILKRVLAPVLKVVAPSLTLSSEFRPELLTADRAAQQERRHDPLAHNRISAGFVRQVELAQQAALAGRLDPALPVLVLSPSEDEITDQPLVIRYFEGLGGPIEVVPLAGTRHEPHNDIGREGVLSRIADFLESQMSNELPGMDRVPT